MHNSRRAWILDNIVSPYGLAAFSCIVFLISCLIPPSLYSHYISEPDLMFLDPVTILFYGECVAAFIAGVSLIAWLNPSKSVGNVQFKTKISPTVFILIPITLGLAITIISDVRLIRSSPTILLFLFAQQGQDLKNDIAFNVEGNVTLPFVVLTAIVWWAFWRFSDLEFRGRRRVFILTIWWIALILVVISTVLTLSRSLLMLAICGLAILYVMKKTLKRQVNLRFVIKGGAAIACCTALPFFAFSFLRGSNSWDDQVYLLIGYTFASYNRLAAVVNGTLRAPLIDRGIHLSGFFAFNQTFNKFIPLNKIMGWRDHLDIFDSVFSAVSAVGLDGHLVWPGAFGDIFFSLGWFSCFFVFGYGLLYGVVWNSIRRGKALGIVLYPNFGFCILFWLGSNQLLSSDSAVLLVSSLLIVAYEMILMTPARPDRQGNSHLPPRANA